MAWETEWGSVCQLGWDSACWSRPGWVTSSARFVRNLPRRWQRSGLPGQRMRDDCHAGSRRFESGCSCDQFPLVGANSRSILPLGPRWRGMSRVDRGIHSGLGERSGLPVPFRESKSVVRNQLGSGRSNASRSQYRPAQLPAGPADWPRHNGRTRNALDRMQALGPALGCWASRA